MHRAGGNGLRLRWLAAGALLAVAGALGAVAYADTINPDGDLLRPNNRLQYGSGNFQEPCAGRGTPVAGAVTVRFNGNVHFDSGSTLAVTAAPDADATAAGITASGSSAVVPSPWNTPQQTFEVPITTTVPASAPDGSYTVDVTATGPAHRENGDALVFTQHDSFTVTIDCVAGGNVAPSISWNAHPFQSAAGDTKTYTFGISDPDSSSASFAPGYPTCGPNGTVSHATIAGGNGSFDCTFGASPASSKVRVRVTDGTSTSNELSQNVDIGVGALASITISPDTATIASGGSQAYTAEGFDSFGTSRGDVTGATVFTISPATGASCTGATCTATLAGNYTVTGTDGPFSDTATLTVANAAPAIDWSAHPASATVGETKSYSFTITDPSSASWSFPAGYPSCGTNGTASNAAIVGSTGSFDCTFATVPGSSTVSAKVTDGSLASNELSQPVSILVGALASITISPDTATIDSGGSQAYTAEGFDSFHNSRGDVTSETAFTIAPNGGTTGASCAGATCTAALAGTYTVTGTDGAFSDTASLTVPVSAFDSIATVNANSSANPIALDYAPSAATVQSVTQGTSGGTVAVAGGAHGVTFTPALDFVGTDTFTYTVTDGAGHTATATVTVSVQTSGTLADAMVFEDDDLKPTNGFDVMFGKSSLGSSYLSVKNTHPDRLELKVDLVNQTGVDIDAARSNRVVAIFTVPDMPTSCGLAGVDCAAAAGALGTPAFALENSHAVHVRPDDRSDEMPVSVLYKAAGPCADSTGYSATFLTAPKCIKLSGFAIPQKHKAKIQLKFRFRSGSNWLASWNPQQYFNAGFNFGLTKLLTYAYGTPSATTYSTSDNLVTVGSGKGVTGIGGFLFDTSGQPAGGAYHVQIWNKSAGASCTGTPVLNVLPDVDGFYFAAVPDGTAYFVQVCKGPAQVASATLKKKLGKNEFDEEDFSGLPPLP
jgi:hypothetical protein